MNAYSRCALAVFASSLLPLAPALNAEQAPKEAPSKPKPTTTAAAADRGADVAKKEPAKRPELPLYPDPVAVTATMKKAAAFMRSHVAFAGGYAWKWPTDMSIAKGEDHSSPTLIMIQPPGTPAIGLSMLNAYQATGDKLFLQGAREAAASLMWCQMATGGWGSDFDFDPRSAAKHHFRRDIEAGDLDPAGRHGDSTLDDQKTQSALLFLLELAHTPEGKADPQLQSALKFGFDGLLAAQAPNGGWPQHYRGPADATAPVKAGQIPKDWPHVWPAVDYTGFYTLNDNNLLWVMRLLLRAHELDRDERYLASAKKLGDFLLLARLPQPQPVWAQQYNREMEPVWARKFEPPAASSVESFGALKALFELWLVTQEDRYLAPMKDALAWFKSVKLADGRWARFYELGTNKPVYCKRDSYELTFDDSDLPTHYGFKTDTDFQEDLDEFAAELAKSRDEILRSRQDPTEPKKWSSKAKGQAAKVRIAMQEIDSKGRWLKDDMIDAGLFVKHFKAMCQYVTAAKSGGEVFESLRKAAVQPK